LGGGRRRDAYAQRQRPIPPHHATLVTPEALTADLSTAPHWGDETNSARLEYVRSTSCTSETAYPLTLFEHVQVRAPV
jgi:hypothetical protein